MVRGVERGDVTVGDVTWGHDCWPDNLGTRDENGDCPHFLCWLAVLLRAESAIALWRTESRSYHNSICCRFSTRRPAASSLEQEPK